MSKYRLLTFLLVLLPSQQVHAHLLKVFASHVGQDIEGRVYFRGGAPASNAQITLRTDDQQIVSQLTSDQDGRFHHTLAQPGRYTIEADTQDGHVARWHVDTTTSPQTSTEHPHPVPTATAKSTDTIALEQAIARQIRPLQEQLNQMQERAKFQDVLGGIGYIMGLAGFALWWRQRPQKIAQEKRD